MAIAFVGNKDEVDDYPVAPKGTYYLKVLKAQEQKSKKSGRDMIALEYVISEGEYEGIHVFSYLVFINAGDKGHGLTLHALNAHGFDAEGPVEITAESFEGLVVKADLDTDTYEGRTKNVIKRYHAAEDPAGTAQEEESPKESQLNKAAVKAGLRKASPWKR